MGAAGVSPNKDGVMVNYNMFPAGTVREGATLCNTTSLNVVAPRPAPDISQTSLKDLDMKMKEAAAWGIADFILLVSCITGIGIPFFLLLRSAKNEAAEHLLITEARIQLGAHEKGVMKSDVQQKMKEIRSDIRRMKDPKGEQRREFDEMQKLFRDVADGVVSGRPSPERGTRSQRRRVIQ